MQHKNYFHSTYTVPGIISHLEVTQCTQCIQEGKVRFYANITPFYTKDLSICGFPYLQGS